jgi:hypothetical protein
MSMKTLLGLFLWVLISFAGSLPEAASLRLPPPDPIIIVID